MSQTTILVQLSTDELRSIMEAAVAEGVRKGIEEAKELLKDDQPVSQEDAMKLCKYRDQASFRKFCSDNRIVPFEVRARKNYYLPSVLRAAQRLKGVHIK